MKLSELVNFRNELTVKSSDIPWSLVNSELDKIMHHIENQLFVPAELTINLETKYKNIQDAFNSFESSLSKIKMQVQDSIKNIEEYQFEESYKRYSENKISVNNQTIVNNNLPANTYYDKNGILRKGDDPFKTNFKNDIIDQTLNKSLLFSAETKELIRSRILGYATWQHPAMIIRPGLENFINDMVANDPLYLIDEFPELLSPAVKTFNKVYQNRLRTYTINEDSMLENLPDNQFLLCLAYNYFDNKPIEIITKYLKEIFKKMCPGGMLGITFNDCDLPGAVWLVEKQIAFYTPGNIIIDIAKNIGYKEIFKYNDGNPSTWLELQKPGSISSIRGGQTLAKIIHKS